METKTRIGYFFIAVALIFAILGVICFLYDKIVVIPEPGATYLGTYHFSSTYEKRNEEDSSLISIPIQLSFRMEEDGTAYFAATNDNDELENTKGSYEILGNEIIYTRLFVQNDESYDLLFETDKLPKKEHFLIQENSILLVRKYFKTVYPGDITLLLNKQI